MIWLFVRSIKTGKNVLVNEEKLNSENIVKNRETKGKINRWIKIKQWKWCPPKKKKEKGDQQIKKSWKMEWLIAKNIKSESKW